MSQIDDLKTLDVDSSKCLRTPRLGVRVCLPYVRRPNVTSNVTLNSKQGLVLQAVGREPVAELSISVGNSILIAQHCGTQRQLPGVQASPCRSHQSGGVVAGTAAARILPSSPGFAVGGGRIYLLEACDST